MKPAAFSTPPDRRKRPRGEPRFLIVQDHKENRRKCTALRLSGLGGIDLVRLARPSEHDVPVEVPGGIWLDVDGPVLRRVDRTLLEGNDRIVVLDASWARLAPLRRRLRPLGAVHARSLPGELRTAYPRRSKLYEDPLGGLATVEAIYAVTVMLGSARPEILEGYLWADRFLDTNRIAFDRLQKRADDP